MRERDREESVLFKLLRSRCGRICQLCVNDAFRRHFSVNRSSGYVNLI